jgi:hypothetical protein
MADDVEAGGQSTLPIVGMADGCAVVRLNRPREHNRLEPSDLVALQETFARIDTDPSIRVLVLTGSGESFSSGFPSAHSPTDWPERAKMGTVTRSSIPSIGSKRCAFRPSRH